MSDEPLAYTIKDACRVSGLGRTLIYEAIGAGKLAKTKIGTRTLIMRADLLKFLESGKEATA